MTQTAFILRQFSIAHFLSGVQRGEVSMGRAVECHKRVRASLGSPHPCLPLFLQLPSLKDLELLLPFLSAVRCFFHGRWYADGAVFSGGGDECTTCVCQVGS